VTRQRKAHWGGLALAGALFFLPIVLAAVVDLPLVVTGLLSGLASLAAVVVVAWTYRRAIRRWLSAELMQIGGASIIAALPPRVVLDTLLRDIYGDGRLDSVLAGILGGAGLDVHRRDIATSRRTVVDVRLSSTDERTYELRVSWTHRLSGVLASYKFVVFATCDPQMWNVLPSQRRVPLYESWFVQNEDMLHSFVPRQRQNLKLGISYRDADGAAHTVEPRSLRCYEPPIRDWPDYVRLPEGVDLEHVRILEFDLGQLVDDDHVVGAIETLSLSAATPERTADGFFSWSPPYPCFVERITFDLADLRLDGDPPLFKIVPFTMEQPGPTFTHEWVPAADLKELRLESWLQPGHGVALLWRPGSVVGEETMNGS
jgi:hypothetical protein